MYSNFIQKADYKTHLRTYRLDQILEAADEDEELILDSAEGEAMSFIADALAPRYNIDVIFGATGDSRHKTVLKWAKWLVIYFIYERIPDEMVPERVVKNYDYVLERLGEVESGSININGLPLKTETDCSGESQPKTRRRWGSVPKRANDGGSPRNLKW